jgi:hypothetical protein
LAAGPLTNEPSEAKDDVWAEQKNVELDFINSTVEPACGHTDDTAKKLVAALPVAVLTTIIPLFAIKSFKFRNSVAKLTVNELLPCAGFVGEVFAIGSTASVEQAALKHAKHVAVRPPVTLDKNSFLFIDSSFSPNQFATFLFCKWLDLCIYMFD